jgi:hypothetical protein
MMLLGSIIAWAQEATCFLVQDSNPRFYFNPGVLILHLNGGDHQLAFRWRDGTLLQCNIGMIENAGIILVIAGTAWLFFIAGNQRLRQSTTPAQKCPTCGYDLRASPNRCPECGSQRD